MQGRCDVCGANDVQVKHTVTDDGQLKYACDQCA